VVRAKGQVDIKIGNFGSAVIPSKTPYSGDYIAPVGIPCLLQEHDLTIEGNKIWTGEKTVE
jgi:hypothetical protein